MANAIQASARVTVRSIPLPRTGTMQDGRPWSVNEVEVLDSDFNKSLLRYDPATLRFEVGSTYDVEFTLEWGRGHDRVAPRLVAAFPAEKPASVKSA